MRKFKYMNPEMIMGVVVSLVILAVGVFAFFATIASIEFETNSSNETSEVIHNITGTDNSLFNIIGVVLIIGVIMMLVGVVYSFVGRVSDYESTRTSPKSSRGRIRNERLKAKRRQGRKGLDAVSSIRRIENINKINKRKEHKESQKKPEILDAFKDTKKRKKEKGESTTSSFSWPKKPC